MEVEEIDQNIKLAEMKKGDFLRNLDSLESQSTSLLGLALECKDLESYFSSVLELIKIKYAKGVESIRVLTEKREEELRSREEEVRVLKGADFDQIRAEWRKLVELKREVEVREEKVRGFYNGIYLEKGRLETVKMEIEERERKVKGLNSVVLGERGKLEAMKMEVEEERKKVEERSLVLDLRGKRLEQKKKAIDERVRQVEVREVKIEESEMRKRKRALEDEVGEDGGVHEAKELNRRLSDELELKKIEINELRENLQGLTRELELWRVQSNDLNGKC